MIFITVKFKVRPEYAEHWLTLVGPFTQATRGEPGNLWFDWSCWWRRSGTGRRGSST